MGECEYSYDILAAHISAKAEVQKLRRYGGMKNDLSAPLIQKHSVELPCEKGASSWLTTLPIKEFGLLQSPAGQLLNFRVDKDQ